MKTVAALMLAVLLCGSARADSRKEADLSARLAAAERDKAELADALAKLKSQGADAGTVFERHLAVEGAIAAQGARTQIRLVELTQGFTLLSLLASFAQKSWIDARNRRWAIEDEAAHRKTLLNTLGEVGEQAKQAYSEANNVNLKIAAIGLTLKDGSPLAIEHPSPADPNLDQKV